MIISAKYEGYIDDKAPRFSFPINKYGFRKFIPYYGDVENLIVGQYYLIETK